jgi:hypothetical protein
VFLCPASPDKLNRLGLTKFPFRDEQFGVLPSQNVAGSPKPVIKRIAGTATNRIVLRSVVHALIPRNYSGEL